LLLTIPDKDYDPSDDRTDVYMQITNDKEYFLVYTSYTIQIQVLISIDNYQMRVDGHIITL
jgi:hypothetical protein